jgi:FtsH-binding integral membrane protein
MNQYNYGGCSQNDNAEWKPSNYTNDIETGMHYKINTELTMRLGFIRKVYGILSIQLLLTTIVCLISMTSPLFASFQHSHPAILWLSMIASIVIMLVICCVPGMGKTVPINYILLFSFTGCEAYMVSAICSMMNPKLVLMAAVMTCAITFALTFYACTTKTDFTVLGSMLFIGSCCLLLFTIFAFFFKALHVFVCVAGVFLYAIYLVYDTQLLIGNQENKLDIEDYIYGALMLYLDIINIFLYILQILAYFKE